jgi:hypothetical protein
MKLSAFKTDTARAEAGDWVEIEAIPGMAFKVRGRNTVAAKALRATLSAGVPIPDRADREAMIRHQQRIEREIIVACLDDWRGIEGDDGKALPFSADMARTLLLDPDFARLADIIGGACDAVQERKAEAVETAAKN